MFTFHDYFYFRKEPEASWCWIWWIRGVRPHQLPFSWMALDRSIHFNLDHPSKRHSWKKTPRTASEGGKHDGMSEFESRADILTEINNNVTFTTIFFKNWSIHVFHNHPVWMEKSSFFSAKKKQHTMGCSQVTGTSFQMCVCGLTEGCDFCFLRRKDNALMRQFYLVDSAKCITITEIKETACGHW